MAGNKLIKEWLAEYKSLPTDAAAIYSYACTVRQNEELITALYELFDSDADFEIVDPVCHQLFEFYRCGEAELQQFTLELVPTLIWAYLAAITGRDKKRCLLAPIPDTTLGARQRRSSGIEACLLGIYNLEAVNRDGSSKVKKVTIPSLAKPSLYHEPTQLAQLSLTETSLSQYDKGEPDVITIGPFSQVENINAQNRLQVLTYVLNRFNANIATLSQRCHQSLCKNCSRLVKTGFDNLADLQSHSHGATFKLGEERRPSKVQFTIPKRIQLNSAILLEMLNSIYYAMFNGHSHLGEHVLNDIHRRAAYEIYSDVLLVTNAIKNSLQYNPSGGPSDGPMGISIAVTPSTSTTSFSKAAITNASFRAKKLPDDIAPQDGSDSPRIEVISEEDRPATPQKFEPSKPIKTKSGPLKSALKKSDNKQKFSKRDSDVSSKSVSSDTGSNMQVNGDISNVTTVTVVHREAKTSVDTIELRQIVHHKKIANVSSDSSKRNSTGSVGSDHRSRHSKTEVLDVTRLSGSSDDVTVKNGRSDIVDPADVKPIIAPASHSRESSPGSGKTSSVKNISTIPKRASLTDI